MKSELDIKNRLNDLRELLGWQMGYDDHDAIMETKTKIDILEWVLDGH